MYTIGKVEYLNTLPLFYRWDDPHIKLIKGHPSHLVKLLREAKIQAGIVSSVEYLIYPQDYVYVPDISISSKEKVCSVGLFSRKPIEQIGKVYLTRSSLTSRYLCVYILEDVYRLKPIYVTSQKEADALLLIGDMALQTKKKGIYPYFYDLAYEWYKVNRLPFVFALFLVRKEYASELVDKIFSLCKHSMNSFFEDLPKGNISVNGFSQKELEEYFLSCLNNRLGDVELKSLKIFGEFLKKRGLIAQSPL